MGQRIEAQARLRGGLLPEGEATQEFERALRLLERYERRNGRIGARAVAHGERSALGFEEARLPAAAAGAGGWRRIVVGVDPPAGTEGDACGILVCGLDAAGTALVLADLSAAGLRPEAWARRVAAAAASWGASRIVAEKNQGGDMVAAVLRAADDGLPVRLVSATASKPARAEPVALRFEAGKAKFAGHFPELEDQLCAMTYGGYEGRGSPDRADAMVWAMTELMEREPAPRVRVL